MPPSPTRKRRTGTALPTLDPLGAEVRAAGLLTLWQGGIFFKGLANFQLDASLKAGLVSPAYLDACFELGQRYADLCSSIYYICGRPES